MTIRPERIHLSLIGKHHALSEALYNPRYRRETLRCKEHMVDDLSNSKDNSRIETEDLRL